MDFALFGAHRAMGYGEHVDNSLVRPKGSKAVALRPHRFTDKTPPNVRKSAKCPDNITPVAFSPVFSMKFDSKLAEQDCLLPTANTHGTFTANHHEQASYFDVIILLLLEDKTTQTYHERRKFYLFK